MKFKEDDFRELLEKSHAPVVADFFATWCTPCKKFGPIFEAVANKLGGEKMKFAKLDIDNCQQLCEDLNIEAVPTVVVFKDSKAIAHHAGGFPSEKDLEGFINKALGK